MYKFIFLTLTTLLFSNKFFSFNDVNTNTISEIELTIKDYNIINNTINFQVTLANNTKHSIFILKNENGDYGCPEFFNVKSTPEMVYCVVSQCEYKPVSYITEIKSSSKLSFKYNEDLSVFCDSYKGKTIKYQLIYKLDNETKNEYIKIFTKNYSNLVEGYKTLSIFEVKSNIINVAFK